MTNTRLRAHLTSFATALHDAAKDGTAHTNSGTGDYTLSDNEALAYAAQAIRDALHRDTTKYPEPLINANQLRHALNDYLHATPSGAYARISLTTDHPLDNGLTIDLGTLVDALADAAKDPHLRPTTLNNAAPFDGQIPGRNYREFAAWWNAATADTKTKPTDPDPDRDPYAIHLQGPYGTIHGADRATPDSLHDLDHRTRAIFDRLLRITLDNLDRQVPTTTGGTR